ncbi:MAG TPA: 3,4-dihydroxy-2-butanone-4-phosphate synthase [Nannocystaceae bacterium]|nr:3,4-dihydroxy-2-butanone-4-phosphate synthase [Nannocystaceae bacterium]
MTHSRIEEVLAAFAAGRMIVLVDDEDRENEGDLVVAAQHCRAEHVNFMCKHGRGLVCLALTPERVEQLRLPMMVPTDPGDMGTAFTVSIEARRGVSTGISARDRAETIRVAVDERCGPEDIVSPGHVFPLRAQSGGVLVRSGHTEGAVDLARLSGLVPAGVICEIMRDDGEMARMDELEQFARRHELPIATIADLIEHRLQRETLVEEVAHAPLASSALGLSEASGWTVRTFRSNVQPNVYYLAICKGELAGDESVLVRAQRASVLGDVFGFGEDSGRRLRAALRIIDAAGRGVFLYVLAKGGDEVDRMLGHEPSARARPRTRPAEHGFRQFGLGAQVLARLGLRRIRVITDNPRKIIGLGGFGIEVDGTVALGDHP